MKFQSKIVQLLPVQTGKSKNGTWQKQDLIVETTETQYPKKICVSVWGDKINTESLSIGNLVEVSFEIESREFNSRWYTDIRAWKIELINEIAPLNENNFEPLPPINTTVEDDLPF
ncbi:MAG: DUF3127 domain-containing protein [Chitinophagaceae bacterium]